MINNQEVLETVDTNNLEVIPHEAIERLTAAGRGLIRPVHWKDQAIFARRSDIRWALAEIRRLQKELYE